MPTNSNAGFGPCPTVKIVSKDSPSGFKIINESDFNEEKDELFDAEEIPEPSSREELIAEAIGRMNQEDSEQWLGDGRPDLNSLRDEAELGDISSDERDAAWISFSESN